MSSAEPGQNTGQEVEKFTTGMIEPRTETQFETQFETQSETQSQAELKPNSTLPLALPIRKTLPNGAIAELDTLRPEEAETVRALLNYFVTSSGTEGLTYPHAQPLSPSEFAAYWLSQDGFVVRAVGDAPPPASENASPEAMPPKEQSLNNPSQKNMLLESPDKTPPDPSPNRASLPMPAFGEVLGAFYLKPNFPGWCSHICNAGFIVQPAVRGQGIGRWMAETMLAIAPTKGYTAVMFNLVFATNEPSLNLWRSLDFSTIGRIPQAARLPNGASVDAIMLYRAL